MGRGGRGGGGRNPANQPRDVQVSRAVSKLLRHGAEQQGLKLGKGGYVNVQDALNTPPLKSLHITFSELRSIVATNDKQRFSMIPASQLSDTPSDPSTTTAAADQVLSASAHEQASDTPSDYLIRANQGHSITVDTEGLLIPITPEAGNVPDTVVHGTDEAALQLIFLGGGLRRMGRTHIHFASGLPAGFISLSSSSNTTTASEENDTAAAAAPVISGMRKSASILIYIDIHAALAAGIPFFVSENGVILTDGGEGDVLSYRLFKRVESRKDGRVIMENGVLPEGVVVDVEAWKGRVGDGKRRGGRGGGGNRGGRGGAGRGAQRGGQDVE